MDSLAEVIILINYKHVINLSYAIINIPFWLGYEDNDTLSSLLLKLIYRANIISNLCKYALIMQQLLFMI